jgi:hypothetical protein
VVLSDIDSGHMFGAYNTMTDIRLGEDDLPHHQGRAPDRCHPTTASHPFWHTARFIGRL